MKAEGAPLSDRDAVPGDASALAALGRDSFVETFGHLYRPEDLEFFLRSHNEEDWRTQLESPDYAVRVAEADGVLAAYAKLGPLSLPWPPERPSIELKQFYVLAPWHGRGIAPVLMDWALKEARRRGASDMYLSVFTDNHRARAFYKRYGFSFVAPFKFMVGDQADEDEIWRLSLVD